MKRERKRVDYHQIVFAYWARPLFKEMPAWYQERLRLQDRGWNDMVAYRNGILEKTKDIADKAERKTYWADFLQNCRTIIKGHSLPWEEEGEIFDRFMTAHSTAMKKGLRLRMRFADRRDRILFTHRFTGGGLPVNQIFKNTGWRVQMDKVDSDHYADQSREKRRQRRTVGVFGFSKDEKIHFAAHVNRQIPEGAIVKKVYWSGKFTGVPPEAPKRRTRHIAKDGWEYSIQFVCEIPPPDIKREDKGIVGLDLGWRSMEERSYIRIGMLSDSAGRHFEIRFPLARNDSHAKRGLQKHLKGQEKIYDSYLALMDLNSLIGNHIEVIKGQIKEVLDPEWLTGLVKMRQGGLNRIIAEMRESKYDGPGLEELEEWKKTNDRLEWIMSRQMRRIISNRRHIYWNLASWLTKNYRVISWEGDLSLKEMAESAGESPVLANAAKFRQWVCLSELRSNIKNGTRKNCNALYPAKAAGSTRDCYLCGGRIITSLVCLRTECENGHAWDQDHNASMNLLSDGFSYGIKEGIVREEDAGAFYSVEIPSQLQGIVVPVALGQ